MKTRSILVVLYAVAMLCCFAALFSCGFGVSRETSRPVTTTAPRETSRPVTTTAPITEPPVTEPPCVHAYGEWTVTEEATCSEQGSRQHTCTLCGKTEEEVILLLPHTLAEDRLSCTVCGVGDSWHSIQCVAGADMRTAILKGVNGGRSQKTLIVPAETAVSVTDGHTTTRRCPITVVDISHLFDVNTVVIGPNVVEIRALSCGSDGQLANVYISASVRSIGEGALAYCRGLKVYEVDEENLYFCAVDGNLYTKDMKTLIRYAIGKEDTHFTVPDGVETIAPYAFAGARYLESVSLPDGLVTIGKNAFAGARQLVSLTVPASIRSVGEKVIADTPLYNDGSLREDGVLYLGALLVAGSDLPEEYRIKDGTVCIADRAMSWVPGTKKLTVPASVVSVGWDAIDLALDSEIVFEGALPTEVNAHSFFYADVKTISITAEVTELWDAFFESFLRLDTIRYAGSFSEWLSVHSESAPTSYAPEILVSGVRLSELTDVVLSEEVTVIGRYAFDGIPLKTLTITKAPEKIHAAAFDALASAPTIVYTGDLGEWVAMECDFAALYRRTTVRFDGIGEGAVLRVPDGTTALPNDAFFGQLITKVILPASIETVAPDAFRGCEHIVELEYLGDLAGWCRLDYDYGLMKRVTLSVGGAPVAGLLTIPDGVSTLRANTFAGQRITALSLPASLTEVAADAFWGCTDIAAVDFCGTISDWCAMDTDYTFLNGGVLAIGGVPLTGTLTIPEDVTGIKGGTFCGQTALRALVLPAGLKSLSSDAFLGCTAIEDLTCNVGLIPYFSGLSLRTVTVTGGTEIPEGTFRGQAALESVTLGAGITAVGAGAFDGCCALATVVLPDVETVGAAAFRDCRALRLISLPSLLTLGDDAFAYCTSLQTVELPTSLATVGARAFSRCESLSGLILGVDTVVGDYAFEYCTSLTTLPEPSPITIATGAYRYCTGLTELSLGTRLRSVGVDAFRGCSSLGKVTFNSIGGTELLADSFLECYRLVEVWSLTGRLDGIAASRLLNYTPMVLGAEDSATYLEENGATVLHIENYYEGKVGTEYKILLSYLGTDTEYTVADEITHIAPFAFEENKTLQSVTLPAGLWKVYDYAFLNADGIRTLVILANQASFSTVAFQGVTGIRTLTTSANHIPQIPTGEVRTLVLEHGSLADGALAEHPYLETLTVRNASLGVESFRACPQLREVYIGRGATYLGTFRNCTGLETVTIYDTNYIRTESFDGCTALSSLSIDVWELGENAFRGCTSLTSLTLVAHDVLAGAFRGCTALASLTLDEVVTLGDEVFCDSPIAEMTLDGSIKEIGTGVFGASLKALSLPASVVALFPDFLAHVETLTVTGGALPASAFSGCTSLKTAELLYDTTLGEGAFRGCTALTGVTLPKALSEIPASAFSGCSLLKSVSLPTSLTKIGENAFLNTGLGCLEIPEQVTILGTGFAGWCTSLTEVRLPSGLTILPPSAFEGCSVLSRIYCSGSTVGASFALPSTLEIIGESAFAKCLSLTEVTLPISVTSLGQDAFARCAGITTMTFPYAISMPLGALFGTEAYSGSYAALQGSKTYYIPAGLTSVRVTGGHSTAYAFQNCKTLTTADVGWSTYDSSTAYVFSGCSRLTEVSASIAYVNTNVFEGCSALRSIVFKGGVQKINERALRGLSSLTSVTLVSGEYMLCDPENFSEYVSEFTFTSPEDAAIQLLTTPYEVKRRLGT